jgi:2',3'-cyclic-nucleotide 2'-phosphodiesterase (5'-nucleotidase family)
VCANLIDTAGAFPVNNRPYVLIEKNGLKIGIVGLISRELYDLVNQNNLVGLKVLSPAETLQKYINELAPETDIVIALTHEGVEDDSLLATEVHGLAVIVGGHSHTRLRSPKVINGVVIVQTGSNLENLGVLDLTIEGKKVTHYNGSLVQLWARPSRPSNALTALVDSMRSAIDKDYSEVLAVLKNDWVRSDSLSPIGTFIADAQRVAAGAEVGFMNNYGIRKDVPAGPLTKKDLFDVLPFRNILVTFQLSGKQLRDVLLNYLRKRATIQISGITARWRRNPDGDVSLVEVRVQGSPLDDTRMYPCAASDFFVGEAKHYLGVEIDHPIYLRQTVFEAVEQAVRKAKVISATVPNRIVQGQ